MWFAPATPKDQFIWNFDQLLLKFTGCLYSGCLMSQVANGDLRQSNFFSFIPLDRCGAAALPTSRNVKVRAPNNQPKIYVKLVGLYKPYQGFDRLSQKIFFVKIFFYASCHFGLVTRRVSHHPNGQYLTYFPRVKEYAHHWRTLPGGPEASLWTRWICINVWITLRNFVVEGIIASWVGSVKEVKKDSNLKSTSQIHIL